VTLSPGTPSIIRRCSTSFLWGTFATNNGTRPSLVSRKARRFPPCESRSVIHPNAARPYQIYLSSIGGLSSYPSYYQFISLWNHEGRQFPVNEIRYIFRELQQDLQMKNPFVRIFLRKRERGTRNWKISHSLKIRFGARYILGRKIGSRSGSRFIPRYVTEWRVR